MVRTFTRGAVCRFNFCTATTNSPMSHLPTSSSLLLPSLIRIDILTMCRGVFLTQLCWGLIFSHRPVSGLLDGIEHNTLALHFKCAQHGMIRVSAASSSSADVFQCIWCSNRNIIQIKWSPRGVIHWKKPDESDWIFGLLHLITAENLNTFFFYCFYWGVIKISTD